VSAGWDIIGRELLSGSLSIAWNLAKVIIPMMIVIELLLAFRLVEKMAARMHWFCRLIGVSRDALLPLLVGLLMGVSYGAGTIMEINRRTPLGKRDLALIGIFIYSCHALLETTILFGIAGGNIVFIGLVRLLIAVFVTAVAARLPWFAARPR
jgi:hypothetical protein